MRLPLLEKGLLHKNQKKLCMIITKNIYKYNNRKTITNLNNKKTKNNKKIFIYSYNKNNKNKNCKIIKKK